MHGARASTARRARWCSRCTTSRCSASRATSGQAGAGTSTCAAWSREQRLIASVDLRGRRRAATCAAASRPCSCAASASSSRSRRRRSRYGEHADDLLDHARGATPRRRRSDQVLVLALRGQFTLSDDRQLGHARHARHVQPGLHACARPAPPEQVMPEPFGEIAASTMVPTSHLLWSGVWLGIATDAVSKAQAVVRSKARAEPGVVPRSAVAAGRGRAQAAADARPDLRHRRRLRRPRARGRRRHAGQPRLRAAHQQLEAHRVRRWWSRS